MAFPEVTIHNLRTIEDPLAPLETAVALSLISPHLWLVPDRTHETALWSHSSCLGDPLLSTLLLRLVAESLLLCSVLACFDFFESRFLSKRCLRPRSNVDDSPMRP